MKNITKILALVIVACLALSVSAFAAPSCVLMSSLPVPNFDACISGMDTSSILKSSPVSPTCSISPFLPLPES